MKVWIDPPGGWKYGFPKVWDQELNPDFNKWIIDEGYPWGLKESFGPIFYVRQWPADDDKQVLLQE